MKRYEQVPHTADMAAKIYGKDLARLFENAAFAMFDMMADLEGLEPERSVGLEVEAEDRESLLVSWLNEALYTSYVKGMVFNRIRVKYISDKKLTATLEGAKAGADRSRINTEIKAATYHDIKIEETGEGLTVTVVFDV